MDGVTEAAVPESAGFSSLAPPGKPESKANEMQKTKNPLLPASTQLRSTCEQSHDFVQLQLLLHLLALEAEHDLREVAWTQHMAWRLSPCQKVQ